MNILTPIPLDVMQANARRATDFLKSISHEQRLLILCKLSGGEHSVNELVDILHLRQPTVSQHLSRLRDDGIVATRREGTTVYYRLARTDVLPIIEALYTVFCAED